MATKNMEQMEHKDGMCGCGCTMCHVGHHRMWRWLVIVFGVALAFGVGMKLGEIKGYIMSEGYGNIHYRSGRMMMYGGDEWGNSGYMMNIIPPQAVTPAAPTETPSTATPAKKQ